MTEIYQDIPTYEDGNWSLTSFDTREDFAEFIRKLFKQPGEYAFNKYTNAVFG